MAFANKCLSSLLFTIWVFQAVSRPLNHEYARRRYEDWMVQHGRLYTNELERETRFSIFKSNLEYIENFNKDLKSGYKLSINQFSDLSNDEFRSLYTSNYSKQNFTALESKSEVTSFEYGSFTSASSENVNWASAGAVTQVKMQGKCGMILSYICTILILL